MTLLPFQVEGRGWLWSHTHGILGDEQGLGKTVQAALRLVPGSIVVCPSHLLLNWRAELRVWRPELNVQVFLKGKDHLKADTDVAIVSYGLVAKCELPPPFVLVCDEAHAIKDRGAQRSKAIAEFAAYADHVYLLTGTPLPNRTRELWTLLRAVRGTKLSYQEFTSNYSDGHYENVKVLDKKTGEKKFRQVWMDDGASNLGELREIVQACTLRRLKKNVLHQLPQKTHQIIHLDAPVLKEEQQHATLLAAIIAHGEEDDGETIPFELYAKIRKAIGLAKVVPVVEHVESVLEDDPTRKIIVFAWHHEVLDALQSALREYGVLRVDGNTPLKVRHSYVERFQSAEGTERVFLGNIQAAGTGLTLTAADTVVFAEIDPVPGVLAQASDRPHRIGQRKNVLVQYCVSDEGLEQRMLELQWRKITTISRVLGDE